MQFSRLLLLLLQSSVNSEYKVIIGLGDASIFKREWERNISMDTKVLYQTNCKTRKTKMNYFKQNTH